MWLSLRRAPPAHGGGQWFESIRAYHLQTNYILIYKFELVDNHPLDLLKKKWVQLETKLEPHFFLSWDWIGTWLESYKFQYTVISAYNKNQELVALAIFTKSVTTRHSILKSTQLKLHQTGANQEDQIWIEYNNFLVDPNIQQEIIHQGLSFIAKYYPAWMN